MAEDQPQQPGIPKTQDDDLSFVQTHQELVLEEDWWWAVHLTLCAVAIIGNFLFLITIVHNR